MSGSRRRYKTNQSSEGASPWAPSDFPAVVLLVVLGAVVLGLPLSRMAFGGNMKGQAILAIAPWAVAVFVSARARRSPWSLAAPDPSRRPGRGCGRCLGGYFRPAPSGRRRNTDLDVVRPGTFRASLGRWLVGIPWPTDLTVPWFIAQSGDIPSASARRALRPSSTRRPRPPAELPGPRR